MSHLDIGIIVFPGVQQLDMTGPYEIFASLPNTTMHLVASNLQPITSATKLILTPTVTFAECPQLDVVMIPGGSGINDLMKGPAADEVHAFLHRQAPKLQFITSVCTGSFVLAAAGLLKGVKATSHWVFTDLLEYFDAIPMIGERVVEDGKFVTAGGVTSGIDFALTLVTRLRNERAAQEIALHLEYDPDPRWLNIGSPSKAPKDLLEQTRQRELPWRRKREDLIEKVTGRQVKRAEWAREDA